MKTSEFQEGEFFFSSSFHYALKFSDSPNGEEFVLLYFLSLMKDFGI